MLKQYSEEELFRRPLSETQRRELLALLDRPASEIDTSDIPEIEELPPPAPFEVDSGAGNRCG